MSTLKYFIIMINTHQLTMYWASELLSLIERYIALYFNDSWFENSAEKISFLNCKFAFCIFPLTNVNVVRLD